MEENEFKVVDRRSSSGAKDEDKKTESHGEKFVMQDAQEPQGPQELDFSTFVLSLATGALIHLGLAPDPVTKKVHKDITLAKQNIDLLAILQDKTKGNLSPDEQGLLDNLLQECRFRFVEASKK